MKDPLFKSLNVPANVHPIDIKDLMVGNWVKDYRDNYFSRVVEINSELVLRDNKMNLIHEGSVTCTSDSPYDISSGRWIDYLEGIPLTEDILKNNLFKRSFEGGSIKEWILYVKTNHLRGYPNEVLFKIIQRIDSRTTGLDKEIVSHTFIFNGNSEIKYVHNLQNLYRLLSGRDMEVSL